MLRLDAPRAPGDGAGGVDDGEVDLGQRRDAVEERRPVRRRLGEDRRDADRGAASAAREPRSQPSASRRARQRRRARAARPACAGRPGSSRSARAVRRARVPRRARASARERRARPARVHAAPIASLERARAARGTRRRRPSAPSGRSARRRRRATRARPRRADSSGASAAIRRRATRSWHSRWSSRRRCDACCGVHAVEDERVGQVVAVRDVEQTRPQVVVLALLEARVVAERVPVEQLAVDEHRRVEERRAEERRPADRAAPAGIACSAPDAPDVVELEDRRADDGRRSAPSAGARAGARAAAAAPRRRRRAARRTRPAPRRARGSASRRARRCSSFRSTRSRGSASAARISGVASVDASSTTRSSRSGTVWPRTLATAVRDVRLAVADGEEHGDERGGRHGRAVAYGPCRGALPSFDLVVATVGRTEELGRLLDSLEAQGYPRAAGDRRRPERRRARRADPLARRGSPSCTCARRAVSRARGTSGSRTSRPTSSRSPTTTARIRRDCSSGSPSARRRRRARRLDRARGGRAGARLGVVEGRLAVARPRQPLEPRELRDDLPPPGARRARRGVRRAPRARLARSRGRRARRPTTSSARFDAGARIAYDPSLVVRHDVVQDDSAHRLRDGASIGYILAQARLPGAYVARMLVRPVGGALVSLVRLDAPRRATQPRRLRGRIAGYVGDERARTARRDGRATARARSARPPAPARPTA